MKLAIVISTNEAEAVFNAMRLGNYAVKEGDGVGVFLVGKGVELDRIEDERFAVRAQAEALLDAGGSILACGTCLKLRESSGSLLCPLSTMKDLYELIRDADRVVSF
ncbi:MAG TPA: DsrE family protein [Gammaproteobacteria bacterium]|nr:DsrE family protein [Gammaproteobacteria bacterium]